MLLIRLVIVFLLLYLVFTGLRAFLRSRTVGSGKLDKGPGGEEMVLDPQCRSYLPKSDAIVQAGRYFCSRECAQKYLSSQSA